MHTFLLKLAIVDSVLCNKTMIDTTSKSRPGNYSRSAAKHGVPPVFISFTGRQPCLFISVLPMANVMLQRQSWRIPTGAVWPVSPVVFIVRTQQNRPEPARQGTCRLFFQTSSHWKYFIKIKSQLGWSISSGIGWVEFESTCSLLK